jgi:hypothetical protein
VAYTVKVDLNKWRLSDVQRAAMQKLINAATTEADKGNFDVDVVDADAGVAVEVQWHGGFHCVHLQHYRADRTRFTLCAIQLKKV